MLSCREFVYNWNSLALLSLWWKGMLFWLRKCFKQATVHSDMFGAEERSVCWWRGECCVRGLLLLGGLRISNEAGMGVGNERLPSDGKYGTFPWSVWEARAQ